MEYKLSLGMKTPTKLRVHAKAKWSAVTVSRILTNELYIGVLIQGKTSSPNYKVKKLLPKDESEWVRIENSHEAIIDHEDFVAVRSLLKRDVRTSPAEDAVYLFSGFLSCADCGQNMIRKTIPSGKGSMCTMSALRIRPGKDAALTASVNRYWNRLCWKPSVFISI